jgi:hypothetical protein
MPDLAWRNPVLFRFDSRLRCRRLQTTLLAVLWAAGLLAALLVECPPSVCGGAAAANESSPKSRAYKGHENEADGNHLVRAFPWIAGTRLDDCQTCHTTGTVTKTVRGELASVELNPCSFCHLIPFPDRDVQAGAPAGYGETLNPFGLAYREGGRNEEALRAADEDDSDGDGFANLVELESLRYPGDASSRPGQPTAPLHSLSRQQLEQLPRHDQFSLLNSHKQQYDTYATLSGVRVVDILKAVGADLETAVSVTVIAPDGFAVDFPLENILHAFPAGVYFAGLDPESFRDPNQGVARIPAADRMPAGLRDGGEIPGEQWIMIAFAEDGSPLRPCHLDPLSGKLNGSGPFRLIVPQGLLGGPGAPDRGSKVSPSGFDDGFDFDPTKDHNAGLCTRGAVAIRVNPLPEGTEEFDWKNGGFSLLENEELIVYGAGVSSSD